MMKVNAGIRAILSAVLLAVMARAGPVAFGLAKSGSRKNPTTVVALPITAMRVVRRTALWTASLPANASERTKSRNLDCTGEPI